jgi:uncharacterized protein (DUF2249 family)
MTTQPAVRSTIDVRTIAPRQRHPLIFDTFDTLLPGEALLLVNDHDPKPLYYQLQAEYPTPFTWNYVESGPEVWQVLIGKPGDARASAEDSCCSH